MNKVEGIPLHKYEPYIAESTTLQGKARRFIAETLSRNLIGPRFSSERIDWIQDDCQRQDYK